jgi:hypothetical protein
MILSGSPGGLSPQDSVDDGPFAWKGWSDADERRLACALARFQAPRDMAAALTHLSSTLPDGDLLIYGAGTHSQAVIEILRRERPGVRLTGVIDRRWATLDGFLGAPTVSPAAGAASCAPILIAHPLHEQDMAQTLIAAGAAAQRLILLYDDPAFAARTLPDACDEMLRRLPAQADNVVIGGTHWTVAEDKDLARALPGDVVRLHFDLSDPFTDDGLFPAFDMRGSTGLLEAALRRSAPRRVYLRTRIETAYLAAAVRRWSPDARLIHEVFDFASLFGDAALRNWLELSDDAVDLSRAADRFSARHSDLIISKRRGEDWRRATGGMVAAYRHYFPAAPVAAAAAPPPPPPWRILYAGILPRPEQLNSFRSDYNFLGILEDVCRDGDITATIYNRLHRGEASDPVFAAYLQRYAAGGVSYRRFAPFDEVMEAARGFHFAWLYRDSGEQDDHHPDTRMVIPNRVASAAAVGLPLIIDADWGEATRLILEHQAGIAPPRGRPDLAAAAVRNADWPALHRGALALRDRMQAENRAVLAEIA